MVAVMTEDIKEKLEVLRSAGLDVTNLWQYKVVLWLCEAEKHDVLYVAADTEKQARIKIRKYMDLLGCENEIIDFVRHENGILI